jgi:hypothetical protein
MYEGISGDIEALAHTDRFNAAQKQVFERLSVVPGGIGLFQGPPGMGKTFWSLHIALPIVTHVLREPSQRCQVMLIAPSNNVADHLATSMQELLNGAHPKQPIMVTRCHSSTTEESQVWRQAGLGRPPEPGSRPPVLEDVGENDTVLNTFETTATIAEVHAEMKE